MRQLSTSRGIVNRINYFLPLALVLMLGTCNAARAQDWLTAYNNSVALFNDGNDAKALAEAQRSEQLYKKQYNPDHNNYRAILRQLAVVCYNLNELDQGKKYAVREVTSWRSTLQVDELSYMDALDILGILYVANQQYDSAIIVLQEAVRLGSSKPGYPATELALKQCHLADALAGSGDANQAYIRFSEAMPVLEQNEELPAEYLSFCYSFGKTALAVKQYNTASHYLATMLEYYPPEYNHNPEVVDALIALGTAHTELTHYSKGETYYTTALERIPNHQDPLYVSTSKLLADNLERQGRHQEAEAILKKAGTSIDKASNQAALLLANQAAVQLNGGNAAGAAVLLDSALAILKANQPIDYNALSNVSYNAAITYRTLGNTSHAKKLLLESIDAANPASAVRQKALIALARLQQSEGKTTEAETTIGQLNLSKTSAWRATEKGGIYNELAGYYQAATKYAQATDYYKLALSAVPPATNAQLYTNIAFNYVSLLQASGNFTEAERLLADIEATLKQGDPALQFKFLQNTGNLYHAKGNLTMAETQYRKALALAANTYGTSSVEYADIILRQATLAKDKGAYEKAEPLFNQALQMVGNKPLPAAAIHNNLGILFQQMGRFTEAREQFEQALANYKAAGAANQSDYVLTEENLATLYSLMGNNAKALQLLAETVNLNKQIYGTQSPNYAISLHNYASLLQKEKQYNQAEALFEQALAIQKSSLGTNHASYANTLHNLAILAEDQKNYTKAEQLLNEVMAIRANLYEENHPAYTAGLYSRAVLMQQMNKFEEAKADFDKVASLYLGQIIKYFPNLSEREKTAFYKKITPVFNRYKEFLLEYYLHFKKDEQVLGQLYNIQIATKAILLNSVNKTRNAILNSGNTALINNFNEWQALKKQLADYYNYSKSKLQAEGINLQQVEAMVNNREKELSAQSAEFAQVFNQQQITWQQVKDQLQPGQAAIELVRIKRNTNNNQDSVTYIALGLQPQANAPTLSVYPKGLQLENKFYPGYSNAILFKKQDNYSYAAFWKPLEPMTTQATTIYLSADGIFNKVNANSLYNPQTKHFVVEQLNVRYISSSRDLLEESQHQMAVQEEALVIANPYYPNSVQANASVKRSYDFGKISQLPGTQIEAESIAKMMQQKGWKTDVETGKNASKQTLLQSQPRVLHIAAHGFFMNEQEARASFLTNPLFRSGLLLAGAGQVSETNKNKGILTAYEVMNMNLDKTELVVLSACQTALGEVQNGEGVYGLQRAFMVAGANTLIMSLWKVDDTATQKLMEAFYTYWLQGTEKHEALRKAQIEIQQQYKFPYYWGAFIMIGI